MDRSAALLLDCLRFEDNTSKISRLQVYSNDDWELVLEASSRQRTHPILYNSLKPLAAHLALPGQLFGKLREAYYGAAVRNLRLYQELLELVSVFNEHNLEVALLKGAYLAEAVYGNIALRSMSDVDLLVRRSDLDRLHDLLVFKGYSYIDEGSLSNTKHLPPYRRGNGVSLEIHFHITDPPLAEGIDINEIWSRVSRTCFEGVSVTALSPEDLYLHLCIHSTIQHGFDSGLLSCLDTAVFIDRAGTSTDWNMVWERGRQWGIARSAYLLAALSDKLLSVKMPEELAVKVSPKDNPDMFLLMAEDMIFSRGVGSNGNSAGTTRYLARLFGKGTIKEKLDLVKQRLIPPADTLFQGRGKPHEYKGFDLFLLYGRRAADLLSRYGNTIWRGLLGDKQTIAAIENENEKNKIRDWLSEAVD